MWLRYLKIISLLLLHLSDAIANPVANYPEANANFIGRKQEIRDINSFFDRKGKIFVLSGISGIGKTQIAKKYADTYRKKYKVVSWIDATGNIVSQIKSFIKNHGATITGKTYHFIDESTDEIVVEEFKNILSSFKWLIVFDNARAKQDITKYTPSGAGNVIITTKNKWGWDNMMEVQKFRRDESIELLTKVTVSKDIEALNTLANLLHDYPLAISQAGAFIKNAGISIEEYIGIFTKERARLWEYEKKILSKDKKSLDDYGHTVKATLEINVKAINLQSPRALDLLNMLSFMANENIPEEVIKAYFKGDALALADTIICLRRYSLIDVKKDNYGNIYSIHEMLQAVVRDGLTPSQKQKYIESIINGWHLIIPAQIDHAMAMLVDRHYVLEQLEKIFEHAEKHKIYNDMLVDLYVRKLEYYVSEKREPKITELILLRIADMLPKVENVHDITLVRYYLIKAAHSALYLADFERSFKDAEIAQKYLEPYKDAYEEWLRLYIRLAQNCSIQGDIDAGLQYSDLGAHIIKNAKCFLSAQTTYYQARARLFEDAGMLEQAYENIELSLLKANEKRSKKTAAMYLIPVAKAKILMKLNRHEEAYSIIVAIDKKIRDTFGDRINYFTDAVNIIAAVYWYKKNDISTAMKHLAIGMQAAKGLYPQGYSRYYALAYTVNGDIENFIENYELAQKHYLQAEHMYNKLLKSLKIDDVSYLYKRLARNSAKLKDSYSLSHYYKKHIEVFGKTHKRSIEIMDYLRE